MIPKFRALNIKTGFWFDEQELVFCGGKWFQDWRSFEDYFPLDMQDCAVMQSTGMKDKNGVEIFEGDILHRKVHVILLGTDLNKWVDEYVRVEWKYGGWHVGEDLLEFVLEKGIDRHTGCMQTALEVIGNIYENPDLLDSDLVEAD